MDGICIHTYIYIYISYGGRKYIMISDIWGFHMGFIEMWPCGIDMYSYDSL
jgi:hypothetical protein